MALCLKEKVALITGASSGIGAATAIGFAKLGAKLSLSGRNKQALDETVAKCREFISEEAIFVILADVTIAADRERLIAETVAKFGQLDILVNNAGIIASGTIETPTLMEDYDRVMEINTRAPLHMTHLATPHLIATRGTVINVSSTAGTRSYPGVLAYCMSKAALDQMTRCTALELAPKGVRVNSVNPGVILTDLHRRSGFDEAKLAKFYENCRTSHPLGRPGNVEEVANAIAFLASDASSFTAGEHLHVDGGRHCTSLR